MQRRRITQAFVLGAGLGNRLRPLTEDLPKPLVPIFHKPLITFALDHLIAAGITKFCVNTHHQPQCFAEAFPEGRYRDGALTFRHEPVLLETGGGIANVRDLLGDGPFVVYSGDILTDIELQPLLEAHFANSNDVTLALRNTGLASGVASHDGRVIDIGGKLGHPGTHDFANISIWNPTVFDRIPPATKISFIPVLVEWIAQGGRIGSVVMNERKWFNIGSRQGYLEIHRIIAQEAWRPAYVCDPEWPRNVAADARVARGAQLRGFSCVGAGAHVGEDAILENTIVWPGAQIASRSDLRNCIVRANRKAEGTLRDTDI